MARLLTMTAVLGLLAAPVAFAQSNTNPAPAMAAKQVSSQQGMNFIKEAAAGGMAEVEFSQLAKKSENAEVKRFAEWMVQDHTKANTELAGIAKELDVEVSKTLDADHQKVRDQLRSLRGKAFDQRYMQVMVEDHEQAAKLFRQEADTGHDDQLKQFAQKTLPTIEEHRKMALDLSRRLSETAAR
jgi:putative membrane protein